MKVLSIVARAVAICITVICFSPLLVLWVLLGFLCGVVDYAFEGYIRDDELREAMHLPPHEFDK